MNYVTFPGLGLDSPIELNPVAFSIRNFSVMWYGVIITCGMLLAYLYALTRAKVERVKSEDITDMTLFLVIFGVIGARLYYIIFKLDEFILRNADGSINIGESLKAMVNLRNGGLAIYGGIILGFLTAMIVARVKRIRFPVILDIIAPSLFIAQAIGRWGNFVNVEAYGSNTDLPWRMGVGASGGAPYVHPTFLYESLWNLIGFILVAIFYKKKKFHGQVFLFYGIWYGLGRAWIEGLRTDSLYIGSTDLRVSQLLSIVIFVVFAVLMAIGLAKAPRVVRATASSGDSTEDNDDDGVNEKSDDKPSEKNENSEESSADGAKESTEDKSDGEAQNETPAESATEAPVEANEDPDEVAKGSLAEEEDNSPEEVGEASDNTSAEESAEGSDEAPADGSSSNEDETPAESDDKSESED